MGMTVEVLVISVAFLNTDRLPVAVDKKPNEYFSGRESWSSHQSFVIIKNDVCMAVPFFGDTLKFPPRGSRPALMVTVS